MRRSIRRSYLLCDKADMLAKGGRHHRGRPSAPARKRRARPVWAGILLIAAGQHRDAYI